MFLYGAGGHAKVIMDILRAEGKCIEALIDDNKDLKRISANGVSRHVRNCWSAYSRLPQLLLTI